MLQCVASPNELLSPTPYLIPDDQPHLDTFMRIATRSQEVAKRAIEVQARIGQEAEALLDPFLRTRRSDLVAESNQIEGYDVSRRQVLEAVASYQELLRGDVHGLMQAMRADPKIVTTLGLYKAQELADEWASSGERPRAYELRQLHALLIGDERLGGRYRTADVAIGGTRFRPPAHYDVPRAMEDFTSWWSATTGDPVLDATVAHAWLTHVHPYEDGNGRLARLLANFALAQARYPPLVVRAGRDRGQYYDALALSDDGNILPLYELFSSVIRRTVKEMSSANYTQDFLADRLLASVDDQRSAWLAVLGSFQDHLARSLEQRGWSLELQGYPDRTAFRLLSDRDVDGNGWFCTVRNERGSRQWLLWFGFNDHQLLEILSEERTGYPSIFVSKRDNRPSAVHPYVHESTSGVFDELFLKPLDPSPILWRTDYQLESATLPHAATLIATQLIDAWR